MNIAEPFDPLLGLPRSTGWFQRFIIASCFFFLPTPFAGFLVGDGPRGGAARVYPDGL